MMKGRLGSKLWMGRKLWAQPALFQSSITTEAGISWGKSPFLLLGPHVSSYDSGTLTGATTPLDTDYRKCSYSVSNQFCPGLQEAPPEIPMSFCNAFTNSQASKAPGVIRKRQAMTMMSPSSYQSNVFSSKGHVPVLRTKA